MIFFSQIPLASAISLTLRPNAPGTYQEWSLQDTTHYGATSDLNDNTYVYVIGSTTLKETEALEDVTPRGTIISITVYVRAKAIGNGDGEKIKLLLRTHDTDHEVLEVTVSRNAFSDYSSGTITENPSTHLAWTWEEINALEIGCRASNLDSGETIQVSEFWIVVEYSPVTITVTETITITTTETTTTTTTVTETNTTTITIIVPTTVTSYTTTTTTSIVTSYTTTTTTEIETSHITSVTSMTEIITTLSTEITTEYKTVTTTNTITSLIPIVQTITKYRPTTITRARFVTEYIPTTVTETLTKFTTKTMIEEETIKTTYTIVKPETVVETSKYTITVAIGEHSKIPQEGNWAAYFLIILIIAIMLLIEIFSYLARRGTSKAS